MKIHPRSSAGYSWIFSENIRAKQNKIKTAMREDIENAWGVKWMG